MHGAKRWLEYTDTVIIHNERIINLPPKSERIYHEDDDFFNFFGKNLNSTVSWIIQQLLF